MSIVAFTHQLAKDTVSTDCGSMTPDSSYAVSKAPLWTRSLRFISSILISIGQRFSSEDDPGGSFLHVAPRPTSSSFTVRAKREFLVLVCHFHQQPKPSNRRERRPQCPPQLRAATSTI